MAGLEHIRASPKDNGLLRCIVSRPGHGERRDLASCRISFAGGVEGDHWAKRCWKTTADGKPDPDVQICIMNARCIDLIAQERSNWPPAGDNLFIDMDLTPDNAPPGTRLAIGSAIIEITAEPHNGCDNFIARYGRDACVFVNTGEGRSMRLRGIYARVVEDGVVSVGDQVSKLPARD
jgi:MOSC domain-containing protein YiiM